MNRLFRAAQQVPRAKALAITSVLSVVIAQPVFAGYPQAFERLERLYGFGWGDGYHACRSSGIRPLTDMPPRTYASKHNTPLEAVRGCNSGNCLQSFYGAVDAASRGGTSRAGHRLNNNAGCDSCAGLPRQFNLAQPEGASEVMHSKMDASQWRTMPAPPAVSEPVQGSPQQHVETAVDTKSSPGSDRSSGSDWNTERPEKTATPGNSEQERSAATPSPASAPQQDTAMELILEEESQVQSASDLIDLPPAQTESAEPDAVDAPSSSENPENLETLDDLLNVPSSQPVDQSGEDADALIRAEFEMFEQARRSSWKQSVERLHRKPIGIVRLPATGKRLSAQSGEATPMMQQRVRDQRHLERRQFEYGTLDQSESQSPAVRKRTHSPVDRDIPIRLPATSASLDHAT
ncbi:MAG: hypothetical protein AAF989_04240 [Planctomycetota bacterium]